MDACDRSHLFRDAFEVGLYRFGVGLRGDGYFRPPVEVRVDGISTGVKPK